jgi:hypothetical protein
VDPDVDPDAWSSIGSGTAFAAAASGSPGFVGSGMGEG